MPVAPQPPDEALAREIVSQNIAYHEATAVLYDCTHPELRHAFQRAMLGRHLRQMRQLLADVERPVMLDVGAGTGRMSLAFARHGWDVIALDNSPAMLEVLGRRFARLREPHGSLTAVVAGAEAFEPSLLRGRTVHAVVYSSVLHHLPDYLASLERTCALLPPGGLLYLTHEPSGQQTEVRTPAMSMVRAWDRFLQNPQRLQKAFVKLRLGHLPPPPDHPLVDYHDRFGIDVPGLQQHLEGLGLRTVFAQEYADCKTAVVAVIATYCLHLPNRRFALLAQRPPLA